MANEFNRNIKDYTLIKTKAFPAAGAGNNTDTIDLGATASYNNGVGLELEVETPALTSFTDSTKSVDYTIKGSTDDSTYTSLNMSFSVAGVAVTGSLINRTRFRLPANCPRYLRLYAAETAAGADITGSSYIFRVLT